MNLKPIIRLKVQRKPCDPVNKSPLALSSCRGALTAGQLNGHRAHRGLESLFTTATNNSVQFAREKTHVRDDEIRIIGLLQASTCVRRHSAIFMEI